MDSANEYTNKPPGVVTVPEISREVQIGYTSKLTVHPVTYEWTATLPVIPLFNPAIEKPRMTTSPIIYLGSDYGHPTEWRIQVSHDYWMNKRQRTVAVYLWRLNNWKMNQTNVGYGSVEVHYVFEFLDKNGKVFCSRENGLRSFCPGAACGWRDFLNYTDDVRSLIELNGNKLHIRAKITIYKQAIWQLENIDPAFDNTTIDIIAGGNLIMKANKAVLIKKSSKFYSLIGNLSEITLLDDPFYLKELLDYMHEGKCSIFENNRGDMDSMNHVGKMLNIATRYSVTDVMVASWVSICDNLSVDLFYKIADAVRCSLPAEDKDYAKPYNTLKRFFRENLDNIKANEEFSEHYSSDCAFFVELLLGPEMEEL